MFAIPRRLPAAHLVSLVNLQIFCARALWSLLLVYLCAVRFIGGQARSGSARAFIGTPVNFHEIHRRTFSYYSSCANIQKRAQGRCNINWFGCISLASMLLVINPL